MPQSSYLQSGDYANYGVTGTTAAQVGTASTIIDAYLSRPEGLVWTSDASGAPGWMAALDPTLTLTTGPSSIAPGLNVAVTVTSAAVAKAIRAGDVLVLDRSNNAAAETVVVVSVTGASVVLAQVLFAHAGGVTLEAGMMVVEEKVMPAGRAKSRLSHWPVAKLVSGMGRYGFGRRSQTNGNYPSEVLNLLSTVSALGGPPQWESVSVDAIGVEPAGDFWMPAGMLVAYYTRVKLAFVCGWPQAAIPPQIKQACANIIISTGATTGLPPGIKSAKAGDTQLTRFAATQMDDDTRALIERFKARLFA